MPRPVLAGRPSRGLATSAAGPAIRIVQGGPKPQTQVRFYTEEEASTLSASLPAALRADLTGTPGRLTTVYPSSTDAANGGAERQIFVGLGKSKDVNLKKLKSTMKAVVGHLSSSKLKEAQVQLPTLPALALASPAIAQHLASAVIHASYKFDKYVTVEEKKASPLASVTFEIPAGDNLKGVEEKVENAQIVAQATNYAREMINERGEVATSAWFEQQAQKVAAEHSDVLSVQTLQDSELQKLGLNLLYSVGKGAQAPTEKIALVGKGITFDTGGLNMKHTGFIEDMYMDNSGAATVLATMKAIAQMKPAANVVAVLCLAENSVSDKAMLPSAIIKSYNGLTVEVKNTDAEGRLVLADGLTYVQRHFKPQVIIDVATLTGACVVALGEYAAGIFTNDQPTMNELVSAAQRHQEVFWPLPILEEHTAEIKGDHADLNNSGKGRYGGASTAAAFLKEFVENNVKWCHLDIAGTAYARQKGSPRGATGFAVHTLVEWIGTRATELAAKINSAK